MDLEVEEPPAIKVIHGDKEPVSFPVVPKEGVGGVFTLSLEFLSSICTGATGLTTLKNNEKKAMLLRDGKFEIYDTTLEYETAVPGNEFNFIVILMAIVSIKHCIWFVDRI